MHIQLGMCIQLFMYRDTSWRCLIVRGSAVMPYIKPAQAERQSGAYRSNTKSDPGWRPGKSSKFSNFEAMLKYSGMHWPTPYYAKVEGPCSEALAFLMHAGLRACYLEHTQQIGGSLRLIVFFITPWHGEALCRPHKTPQEPQQVTSTLQYRRFNTFSV